MLAAALEGNSFAVCENYSDLAAFGTIADLVPLCRENRNIVKAGLLHIENSERQGILSLIEQAQIDKISAGNIAFRLAPRINAAGRLGQTEKAEELMLTGDPAEAARLTAELGELNRQRQKIENDIWRDAQKQLRSELPEGPIVLAAEGWHQGVIGIAASRLAEQYGLPTVMISLSGENGKGSCRSCQGFNLYEALSACSGYLEGFGGHALAAGLTIRRDQIEGFRAALSRYYDEHRPEPQPDVCCDLLLCDSGLLSIENVQALDRLEPYGSANPKPVLCISDVLLLSGSALTGFSSLTRKMPWAFRPATASTLPLRRRSMNTWAAFRSS